MSIEKSKTKQEAIPVLNIVIKKKTDTAAKPDSKFAMALKEGDWHDKLMGRRALAADGQLISR